MPELTVEVGSTKSVELAGHFTDADGDVLTYTASSSNTSIATVSVSTATVHVAAVAPGNTTVTVTATDPGGLLADHTFRVSVPNRVPVAGEPIEDIEVVVGEEAQLDVSANFSDPDGDALSYTATTSDAGVATVSVSGSVVTVGGVSRGAAHVTVTATDPGGLFADHNFRVSVPNRVPVAGEPIEDIEVVVGEAAQVDVSANFSDPDGDALSYTATTSDAGMATVSVSGSVVTVGGVSRGTAHVTMTATDPGELSATQTISVTVRVPQRRVLEILYDELDGDNWNDNTNWKTDKPLDEWYGLGTNADGRVDSLRLTSNQLTGELPPELGDLSSLVFLDLGYNWYLTGKIPPELGDLSQLEYLSFATNPLDGEIPPELGDLSNLEYLYLYKNELTGEIPSELGNLSNLKRLELYNNRLTGEIPSELGNLSNLVYLYLHGNRLTGVIPSELGSLSNLEYLYLRSNRLIGEIPSELGELSNLRHLYLSSNRLTGVISPEPGDLANLEHLYLYHNSLAGAIPPELGNLSNLRHLFLQGNRLTGEIPPELGNLANLARLNLESNQLTGAIPSELGNLANLARLNLESNQLSGEIPPELGDLSNLQSLYLAFNSLRGEIPTDFLDLPSLRFFYWYYNDGVCAPDSVEFDDWLRGMLAWSGPRCD